MIISEEHLYTLAEKYNLPDIIIGYYWGWYRANKFYDKESNRLPTLIGFEISLKKMLGETQ